MKAKMTKMKTMTTKKKKVKTNLEILQDKIAFSKNGG